MVVCHGTLMETVHEAKHKDASLLVFQAAFHNNRKEYLWVEGSAQRLPQVLALDAN